MFHKYVEIDLTFQDAFVGECSKYIAEIKHPTKDAIQVFKDITQACKVYREGDPIEDSAVLEFLKGIDNLYEVELIDTIFTVKA